VRRRGRRQLRGGSGEDAARLLISIRTVQTHLGHVYDKLGSSGRSDLAARLVDSTVIGR